MRNVWHLQLPSRTKAAVASVFGIGFLTLVVSIARLITLVQIDIPDFTYTSIPADITSLLEPSLMITCACLPIMRPLFRRFLPSVSGRSGNGNSRHRAHSNLYASGKLGDSHGSKPKHGTGPAAAVGGKGNKTPKRISIISPGDGFQRLRDQEEGKEGVAMMLRELSRKASDATDKSVRTLPEGRIEVTREIRIESE